MNKKLLALLDQINAQKQTVIDLANAGKLEEAKAAKKELQDLQDKFDLLKDIEDPDPAGGDDGSGNEPGGGEPTNKGERQCKLQQSDPRVCRCCPSLF